VVIFTGSALVVALYSDILAQEPGGSGDTLSQYSEPASQRHIKELELF
jgi:hypothetical protein